MQFEVTFNDGTKQRYDTAAAAHAAGQGTKASYTIDAVAKR